MPVIVDIWNTVHAIILSSGMVALIMMAVIALAAGFMMQSFNSIVTTTFVALLAFALTSYAYAVARGANAAASAQADWHSFLDLHMLTLVAYALTFAVAIGIVHFVRSLIIR